MKFLDELKKLLSLDERFIGEEGQIIKTRVSDAARSNDKKLLKALLNNGLLKEIFFTKIDDIYVFDKNKFVWILDSKEFLPDSYTIYKNKIGLVDRNNNLISQKEDISLVWPYKDCILEGGQTKEDQKRNEIFYNEILAAAQVNRLLAPKVLSNAKRYTKDGVEENIEFKEDDNLIIKGNNLLALSSLLERYEGEVKCIYIDPPYNTGNDSFKYNDKFNHSTWLTFMRNRLELAKRLLREDGVIFIQCDDNEQAYLKVLMDEVFGRENFIASAPRKTGAGAAANRANYVLRKPYDFILIYTFNKLNTHFNKIIIGKKEYPHKDEYGEYSLGYFQATGSDATRKARPKLYYPVYVDIHNNLTLIKNNDTVKTILPNKIKGEDGRWMWSKEKFEVDSAKYLYFAEGKIYRKIYFDKNNDQTIYQVEKAYFDDTNYQNSKGTKELQNLLGYNIFNNPKPEALIAKLIELSTNTFDLILDFHLGSGTTAAVAHKMGRRYIGIEQMRYIENVTIERLKKVISGEQGGISKAVNWQGGGSFVYCELLEDNESFVDELKKADNIKNVRSILDRAIEGGKLIPSILPSDLKESQEDFEKLSLDEQKNLVMELLNKNKLYVNLSDIDDENYNVNEMDKKFTRSFYNKG